MNLWSWLWIGFGIVTLGTLGWRSVQSLVQARLLATCRRSSLAGLAGSPAAVRGRVTVHRILRVAHLGDCLWHREIVTFVRGRRSRTESDVAERADFTIEVGGERVRLSDNPTEVQGSASRTTEDDRAILDLLTGRQRVVDEWLPVVETLTVVGRLRRGDGEWEMARDPKAGLFVSVQEPMGAARSEALKGWLGVAGVAAGAVVVAWVFLATRG